MATRLPHEYVAFRKLSMQVYFVRRSPTFTFGRRWQWWLLHIWLVRRQAQRTPDSVNLVSSLLQFFRDVPTLKMN
jgi:hypothetical protein